MQHLNASNHSCFRFVLIPETKLLYLYVILTKLVILHTSGTFRIRYPVLPQYHVKDPGHPAKGAGGRLQLNTHTPYIHGFEWSDTLNLCMFEWCTQNLRRDGSISRGTSHATTTERYQYTTSVDINNTRYKKDTVTHSELHATCTQWVYSRAENSAI